MVTDIIDKDEPLRIKLRTLGTGIISDINSSHSTHARLSDACDKISETLSFLDIASTVNIISEMNCNILRKEFSDLNQSIKEATGNIGAKSNTLNLSEFFNSPLPEYPDFGRGEVDIHPVSQASHPSRGEGISKGHTRIGVQKGSTLMKALSKVEMSDRNTKATNADNFFILKNKRRDDLISIIRMSGGGATIKDIRDRVHTAPSQTSSLVSCGEKTLQRELVSMVKDGVLNKTGDKRWSRYFVK
jgi:hypothetical protein